MCECDDTPNTEFVNDRPDTYVAQEGGDHYQAEFQHWDWVIDAKIGYLAGNATKYISRWRRKNGIADLKKAMTYIDKMIATRKNSDWHYSSVSTKDPRTTMRFIKSAELSGEEANLVIILSGDCDANKLKRAKERLEALIKSAQRAASTGQRVAGAATPPQATPPAQQALRGAPSKSDAPRQPGGLTGMEHPFGYDETLENGDNE